MLSSSLIRWSVILSATAWLASCERRPTLFSDQVVWIERATTEGLIWMTPGIDCLIIPSPSAVRVNVQTLDHATAIAREREIAQHNRSLSRKVVAETCAK